MNRFHHLGHSRGVHSTGRVTRDISVKFVSALVVHVLFLHLSRDDYPLKHSCASHFADGTTSVPFLLVSRAPQKSLNGHLDLAREAYRNATEENIAFTRALLLRERKMHEHQVQLNKALQVQFPLPASRKCVSYGFPIRTCMRCCEISSQHRISWNKRLMLQLDSRRNRQNKSVHSAPSRS